MSDAYCPLIMYGFDTRTNQSCCLQEHTTKFDSFSNYKNSNAYKLSVTDMQAGIQTPACKVCWDKENVGAVSLRQSFIKTEDRLNIIDYNGITYLTVFLGNKCNLFCRTCHPASSIGLLKESNYINTLSQKQLGKNIAVVSKRTMLDIESIKPHLDTVMYIEFLGGEPLYDTQHYDILNILVEKNRSKDITLFYSTNATIALSEDLKRKWEQFKSVTVSLSIDAVGKQFEYIRTGGDWKSVDKNINDLYNFSVNQPMSLMIHPTISILNSIYLNDLWEYFDTFDNIGKNNFVFVKEPVEYTFSVLDDIKKDRLLDYVNYGKFTDSIKNKIIQTEYNTDSFEKLKIRIQAEKEFRGLDIRTYLPELCNILDI